MSAPTSMYALGDTEDCLRSLPKELAALAQLMRLSAEHQEPLSEDETRGVCDLLHLMIGQAAKVEEAFDKLPHWPASFHR